MKKIRTAAEELAAIVLSWDLKTDQGQNAQRLARLVLGENEPEWQREFLINTILMEADVPRLEDLKKSLLDMSTEELRAKIARIREDRIIRKEKPKTKVQKAERKSKIQSDLATLLAGMTPEEVETFMKELEA